MKKARRKNLVHVISSFLLLSTLVLNQSCDDDDDLAGPARINGFYRIKSLTIDRSVDLNRDGVASTNFIAETQPYDFGFPSSGLIIRPYMESDKITDKLFITIPQQQNWPTEPEKPITFTKTGLDYFYSYQAKTGVIEISLPPELNTNYEEYNGKLHSLTLQGNTQIIALLSKTYFDYQTMSMVKLHITEILEKVEPQ